MSYGELIEFVEIYIQYSKFSIKPYIFWVHVRIGVAIAIHMSK